MCFNGGMTLAAQRGGPIGPVLHRASSCAGRCTCGGPPCQFHLYFAVVKSCSLHNGVGLTVRHVAIFGHLRNEQDRRKEVERRRLNVFATPGGAWEMKDVSATGLRLTAPMQAACSVARR